MKLFWKISKIILIFLSIVFLLFVILVMIDHYSGTKSSYMGSENLITGAWCDFGYDDVEEECRPDLYLIGLPQYSQGASNQDRINYVLDEFGKDNNEFVYCVKNVFEWEKEIILDPELWNNYQKLDGSIVDESGVLLSDWDWDELMYDVKIRIWEECLFIINK